MKKILSYYPLDFLLISMLLFNPILLKAQNDYREGYLINNNLDTLYGFIDYNSNLFQTCKFKRKLTEDVIIYKPFEINCFRFKDDKYFLSKKVTLKNDYDLYGEVFIKHSTTSRNDIVITREWYPDSGFYDEYVFVEFLLQGEINIYYCIDSKDREHYFLEKSDSIFDLTLEEFKTFHKGVLYGSMERKEYVRDIAYVMRDVPEISKEIQTAGLNHKDLIKLGKEYHNYICKDKNCIIYAKQPKKANFNFGLFGGIGYSNLSYLYTEGDLNPAFSDKNSIHIGTFLHIRNISTNKEKLSLKLTVDYWKSNYITNYNTYAGWMHLAINSNNLLASLQLVNNISTHNISPYYEVGFDLLSSFNESFIDETFYLGRIRKTSFAHKRVGINLGIGTEISLFKNTNHLFFEIVHHQLIQQFITNLIIGYEF